MYVQKIAENFVQKAYFVLEIFSFQVDAYMYVQKTFFSAVADVFFPTLVVRFLSRKQVWLCETIFLKLTCKSLKSDKKGRTEANFW